MVVRFLSAAGEVDGLTSLDTHGKFLVAVLTMGGGVPGDGADPVTIEAVEVDGKRFAISPIVLWSGDTLPVRIT
jgi:hypothetical protein